MQTAQNKEQLSVANNNAIKCTYPTVNTNIDHVVKIRRHVFERENNATRININWDLYAQILHAKLHND